MWSGVRPHLLTWLPRAKFPRENHGSQGTDATHSRRVIRANSSTAISGLTRCSMTSVHRTRSADEFAIGSIPASAWTPENCGRRAFAAVSLSRRYSIPTAWPEWMFPKILWNAMPSPTPTSMMILHSLVQFEMSLTFRINRSRSRTTTGFFEEYLRSSSPTASLDALGAKPIGLLASKVFRSIICGCLGATPSEEDHKFG